MLKPTRRRSLLVILQTLFSLVVAFTISSVPMSAQDEETEDMAPAPQPAAPAFGPCPPAGATELTGAGATFPAPLYTRWFADYATLCGVRVNYQAIGSGGGIQQ